MRSFHFKIIIPSILLSFQVINAQTKIKKVAKTVTPITTWNELDKKILSFHIAEKDAPETVSTYISQQTSIDSLKARLAFLWVANNIDYDITKTAQIDLSNENTAQKTLLAFYNRKGICEDYANIYSMLLSNLSIKNYIIYGEAMPDKDIKHINAHSWVAAQVNNTWYLYDPTWSAGGITVTGKFVRNINLIYYKKEGVSFIKSHMPFDYMWQLLEQPYKTLSLESVQTKRDIPSSDFNYADSIQQYASMNAIDQYRTSLRRISEKLYPTPLFRSATLYYANRLIYLQNQIIIEKQEAEKLVYHNYNESVDLINEATADFNIYIDYRNKQFKPNKTDEQIKGLLMDGYNKAKKAQQMILSIETEHPNEVDGMSGNKKLLQNVLNRYEQEYLWLEKYLKKGKLGRALMFTGLGSTK